MTFSPTKVNSGNSRPVNQINVLNAENRDVEREQLNRILSSLGERISVVESSSGSSSGGSSSSSFTITTDSSLSAISGTDTYQISVAVGGVTENRLASNAVTTAKIANNAVTDAKFRQSTGLSVIGRSANSTGNVADITAGTDGHVLRRSGTTLGFGTIPNTSVTGLGTMSTQNATAVAITGGTINGTSIGATTPSTGAFSSSSVAITARGTTLDGIAVDLKRYNSTTVTLLGVGEHSAVNGTPASFGGVLLHGANRSVGISAANKAFSAVTASDVGLIVGPSGTSITGTLSTTGQADLATGDGGGIRHTLSGATLEMIARGDLGFCIVGSDTDHDLVLRRNNSERARLTSTGASITGTLSAGQTTITSDSVPQAKLQRGTAGNVRLDIVRPSLSTEVAQIVWATGATLDYQAGLINDTNLRIRNITAGKGIYIDTAGQLYAENNTSITGTLSVSSTISASNLLSGTYTPTASNLSANISSVTPGVFQYTRVGDVITGSGTVSVSYSLGGSGIFNLSIPVASNFTSTSNLAGAGTADNGGTAIPARIIADTTNDNMIINVPSTGGSGILLPVHFTYRIL